MRTARQAGVYVAWALVILAGVAAGLAVHWLWEFRTGLERLADQLTLEVGPESTLIYDANNDLVSALFDEHRIVVPLGQISPHLREAILARRLEECYSKRDILQSYLNRGGVYEELRHVDHPPELCPLLHREIDSFDSTLDQVVSSPVSALREPASLLDPERSPAQVSR